MPVCGEVSEPPLFNRTGEDFANGDATFRVDNLRVQVFDEMQTSGSPAPTVAKPNGIKLAKRVHGLVDAAA